MMITGQLAEKGFHALDAKSRMHTKHNTPQTWIVVADREQAYVYRKTTNGLEALAHAEAKGKQIRSVDDHTFSLQALKLPDNGTPNPKQSRHEDIAFIHRLVEWLDIAEKERVFDQLVLVAAPYTLGNLRTALTKNLQRRLRGSVNKELTRSPVAEILGHLDNIQAG